MNMAVERLARVSEWFTSHGGWLSPSVELAFSKSKGTLLRVKDSTTTPLAEGTRVISCPHSLTLSALNALGVQPSFPRAQLVFSESDSRDLELPEEFAAKARRQCIAAIILATQTHLNGINGGRGYWGPYIECLPSMPGKQGFKDSGDEHVSINTPMWWDESERTHLRNTNIEKGLQHLESAWKQEWNQWSPTLLPWAESHGVVLSWELYKWSLSILDSRAFGSSQIAKVASSIGLNVIDEYDPDMLLYPVFDMLNHDPNTRNHWYSDADAFHLICDDQPGPADEVFSYYGPKSNDELMLSYGFCLENNPFESIALKLAQKQMDNYMLSFPKQTTDNLSFASHDTGSLNPFGDPEVENKYGNTRTPLPQDSNSGTFFIRSIDKRNKYDKRFGYPDTASHKDALESWKRPFPEDLLSFLSSKVANRRESAVIEHNRAKIKTDKYAGIRNQTAVASNALLILITEAQKLRAWKHESTNYDGLPLENSNVQLYKAGKEQLIRECIISVGAYLGRVTGTSNSTGTQSTIMVSETNYFLTLPHAYALLLTLPSPLSTVTRLLLRRTGVTAETHNPDPEISIVLWVFFVGLISQLPIHLQNPQPENTIYEKTLSRHRVFASRYSTFSPPPDTNVQPREHDRGDIKDLIRVAQTYLTNTRTAAPGRFKIDEPANPLNPSFWTDSLIGGAFEAIEEELVDVGLTISQRRHMNRQWNEVFPNIEIGEEDVKEEDADVDDLEYESELVPVLYFPTEEQEEEDRRRTGQSVPTDSISW